MADRPRADDFAPLRTGGVVFSAVIAMPLNYEVYDFTEGYDPDRVLESLYGVASRKNKHPNPDKKRPGIGATIIRRAHRRRCHRRRCGAGRRGGKKGSGPDL